MRLIDADVFNHFDYSCFDGQLSEDAIQGMDTVLNVIDTAPTIDAEPVRHGHWVRIKYAEGDWMRCSACEENIWTAGEFAGLGYLERFCPNCGAKMDE